MFIQSSEFSISSPNGKTIRGVIDWDTNEKGLPLIIITPAYGKVARDYLYISMHLVKNGFRVVRFDNTNHIGTSEGDIADFTSTSAIVDLQAVIKHFSLEPLGIVAPSLSARMAFRALSDFKNIGFLITLVGVVNLRKTLEVACEEDVIGLWLSGKKNDPKELYRVLDYDVKCNFGKDAIEQNLVTLESSLQDIKKLRFPVINICSEEDTWVAFDDVLKIFKGEKSRYPREIYLIPEADHELNKNPVAARLAIEKLVKKSYEFFYGKQLENYFRPKLTQLIEQNKFERNREWKYSPVRLRAE